MHKLPHYHCYTCLLCLHITATHALLLSYGSPFILHVLLCHVTVFMLQDCFLLLIRIFLILDMWYYCFLLLIWTFLLLDMRAVDMRYVGIPHLLFPFPGILFMLYCSCDIVPVSRYIVLCYQQSSGPVITLSVSCTISVLVTLYTWYIRS